MIEMIEGLLDELEIHPAYVPDDDIDKTVDLNPVAISFSFFGVSELLADIKECVKEFPPDIFLDYGVEVLDSDVNFFVFLKLQKPHVRVKVFVFELEA